jgi:hypothetical protein
LLLDAVCKEFNRRALKPQGATNTDGECGIFREIDVKQVESSAAHDEAEEDRRKEEPHADAFRPRATRFLFW